MQKSDLFERGKEPDYQLPDVEDIYYVDLSEQVDEYIYREGQREWSINNGKKLVRKQLFYQGEFRRDYRVEICAYELYEMLHVKEVLGLDMVKPKMCRIIYEGPVRYGIVMDNFIGKDCKLIPMAELFHKKKEVNAFNKMTPAWQVDELVHMLKDNGIEKQLAKNYIGYLLLSDALFLNVGRSFDNIGLMKCKDGSVKLIPLYDYGRGLFEAAPELAGKLNRELRNECNLKLVRCNLSDAWSKHVPRLLGDHLKELRWYPIDLNKLTFPSTRARNWFAYAAGAAGFDVVG